MATKKKLFRMPDGAARSEMPAVVSPQLATLVASAPRTGQWEYEVKFDGYRMGARLEGKDVRLITRNANDWTTKLPALAEAVRGLLIKSAWLDGEIVIADGERSSFQALQNAFDSRRMQDIQYYVFDLPFFDGYDLRNAPLQERRRLLKQLLKANKSPRVKFSESFGTDAKPLWDAACRMNLEGIIGKRLNSVYIGKRSPSWIKLKCTKEQEFVVVGYTDPEGSRTGFGSLILGLHDPEGLRYAGNVGTGFDERTLVGLYKQLIALKQVRSPLSVVPGGLKGHWVRPTLVAQVSFSEWTDEGRIRHPVFKGLRTVKPASMITREIPLKQSITVEKPVSNRWRRKK